MVFEIHAEDQVFHDFEDIKSEATCHFKEIYSAEENNYFDSMLLDLVPKIVKTKHNHKLTKKISMEELKEVVDEMKDDKAPGPDGFNATFIKICWDIIEKDLLKMVTKYQRCDKVGGSTNSAFLALIPKEKEANSFDKFRQISLCNIGYKMLMYM